MKRLIIFDLDGTLVNSVESIAYCGNYALKKAGFSEIDVEKYKILAGDGLDTLLERMLEISGDSTHEKFTDLKEYYSEVFEEGCLYQVKPFPQITNLLKKLKENGLKTAILSNKLHNYTCKVVKTCFESDIFDIILGQKPENPKKPDPAGAILIANELNISHKDCIYVGDTNTDMQTGKSAGMLTIGVKWGFRTSEELINSGADKIISNPLEILDLI